MMAEAQGRRFMLEFAGNFVYVSRSLPRCIGRKLLKKASFSAGMGF